MNKNKTRRWIRSLDVNYKLIQTSVRWFFLATRENDSRNILITLADINCEEGTVQFYILKNVCTCDCNVQDVQEY